MMDDGKTSETDTVRKECSTSITPKFVRFENQCTMYIVPCVSHYTEEERYSIWMDPLEYKRIKRDCLSAADEMIRGTPENGDLCFRGLEWKKEVVKRRRQQSRLHAALAVFDEQERQYDEGNRDVEAIRQAYEAYTNKCLLEAQRKGALDAEAADHSQTKMGALPHALDATRTNDESRFTFNTNKTHKNAAGLGHHRSRMSRDPLGPQRFGMAVR